MPLNISLNTTSSLESTARQICERFSGYWKSGKGMCCCPAHDDSTPSLGVSIGTRAVLFHCFAGCSQVQVLEALARQGIPPAALFNGSSLSIPPKSPTIDKPSANALRLWKMALPISGSVAESYLRHRHIDIVSSELRYLERTPFGPKGHVRFLPAMLAAARTDTGIIAIQRTFLDARTATQASFKNPKRALGTPGIGTVRLFPPRNGILGLAEGSESALSATILKDNPCWATLGNERFGIVTIPESVRELYLFVDNDAGGDLAEKKAREHFAMLGRRIHRLSPPNPGDDWNDELAARFAA
ncbi:MAG: toprim domain-containing protein [Pseudomonadota bacterium]